MTVVIKPTMGPLQSSPITVSCYQIIIQTCQTIMSITFQSVARRILMKEIMPAFFTIYTRCTRAAENCRAMDLEDFTRITSRDDAGVIEFCQERGLLHKRVHCSTCQRDYSMIKWKSDTCGYVFRCARCRSKKKLTSDTFFDRSKLPLRKLLGLIYMWAYKYSVPVSTTTTFLGISSATVVQWFHYCRHVKFCIR